MEIWPAVDWLDGYMVRLERGQYDAVTRYGTNPVEVFKTRYGRVPKRIHLVDLNGARSGCFTAWSLLSRLHSEGIDVEAGGGFRDKNSIERALNLGAKRVVLGTRILQDPKWAAELLSRFQSDQLVPGIDIVQGRARVRGWTEEGGNAVELWRSLYKMGYLLCNVTDISRDGTLDGINAPFWQEIVSHYPGNIGAGGGIRSAHDLETLQQLGIHRVVIGKAWLNESIDLSQWEGVF
ncbi:MAG: HisA/HisF-related TIM barrel protein [Firmicutes bacterium]|jgi:phosphoribosylformimino-5-aminoimidazole carboxamide ribotide isomerase|nr:HisA/HisF-related TIM barrel protein [Bacillota bacterium]MCL5012546.1 HisA/HisF-related TIM barrel protein [Bacillota bacterium]